MSAVSENEQIDHQKKMGGKRVTLEALENNIKDTEYFVHKDTCLTICILTLNNGFTVTGESACADPTMFNKEIGERIARGKAAEKIWPLMGYALKEEIYQASLISGEPETFETRLRKEAAELNDKLTKLTAFINGDVQFKRLTERERNNLIFQENIMKQYLEVLIKRIEKL